MAEALDTAFVIRWLGAAAEAMEAARAELCALDGEVGDGDHGTSMAEGFAAALAAARACAHEPPDRVLRAAGTAFLGAVGATVGPLYATAMTRAGTALAQGGALPEFLSAIVEGIGTLGRASPGDRTMIDAWGPAAQAAHAARAEGQDLAGQVRAAETAAAAGARETRSMVAAKGRAVRLGSRSLGHVDPGARSASLVIAALGAAIWPDR